MSGPYRSARAALRATSFSAPERVAYSKRSLAKALAWRAFAACNTLFASIVLTKGKAGVASKIAGADTVVKTVLFYFYERAWAVIPWGKSAA